VTASRVAAARKPPSTIMASSPDHTRMKPSCPNASGPTREATSGSTTSGSSSRTAAAAYTCGSERARRGADTVCVIGRSSVLRTPEFALGAARRLISRA
jgi:hypothetical protein